MFSLITIDQATRWDQIVKSFKHYDVYYLSGYMKAFQIHGDGTPLLFFYENEDLRAINVVMKKDIEKNVTFSGKIPPNVFFDISTPYGYGGFLIEGQVTTHSLKNLNGAYISVCKERNIISEFVRFHPVLDNSRGINSIYHISKLGRTITMNLKNPEQVGKELTSKNRNVIRKAQKSGVEIFWGRNSELYKQFIPLYNETMSKNNAKSYYYFKNEFYKSILNDLRYNSLMFYAIFKEKIIAMAIILFANQQMHYHLSASDREYQYLAPTNLILYEAACWGSVNGYKSFHLGGGVGSEEDSLFKFKKAFNKNSNTFFSIGGKIFDEDKYNELIEIRKQKPGFNSKTSFFPAYRG